MNQKNKIQKSLGFRLLSVILVFAFLIQVAVPNTLVLTASADGSTDDEYVIKTMILKENEDSPSMSNVMFAEDMDVKVAGDTAEIKLYVAYPVPAFPSMGTNGTVKDLYITYNGENYDSVSDIETKPLRPMKETHSGFGLIEGQKIPTQVITISDLPKEALSEELLDAGCYVNVMMNSNVKFRIKLDSTNEGNEENDVNKEDLNAKIEEAEGIELTEYTEETVELLNEKLAEAKSLFDNEDASQEDVDNAVSALDEAIKALEEIVDKTKLEAKIAIVEAIEKENYTEESVEFLNDKLVEAKALLDNDEASQEEVDAATVALEKVIKGLVEKEDEAGLVDGKYTIKTKLMQAYNNELSMSDQMFTEKMDVKVAGDKAEIKLYVVYPVPMFPQLGTDGTILRPYVAYNGTRYNGTIDITTKPLKETKSTATGFGLTPNTMLPMQILTFNKLPKEALSEEYLMGGGYVNVVMNRDVEFKIYLNDIESLGSENTADENNAEDTEEDSAVDKSTLQSKIKQVKKMNISKYTSDSVAVLEVELAEAEAVIAQENVSQDALNSALKQLQKAMDALVKKVDKTLLEKKINEVKAIEAEKYTNKTLEKLEAELEDAKLVFEKENVSQEEVDKTTKRLANAMADLVKKEDEVLDYKNLKDGIYQVGLEVRHYDNPSQLSMSDVAIVKPANIVVKNGQYYLQLTLQAIKKGFGTGTFKGYLGTMQYENEQGSLRNVEVLEHYSDKDDFYDVFKEHVGRSNPKYPKVIRYPIPKPTSKEQETNAKVFVPVMESFGSGMGSKRCKPTIIWKRLSRGEGSHHVSSDNLDETKEEETEEEKAEEEKAKAVLDDAGIVKKESKVDVETEVKGNTAKVKLTTEQKKKMKEVAKKTGQVVIEMPKDKKLTKVNVDKDIFKTVVEAKAKDGVAIVMEQATIQLDDKTVENLSTKQDVSIELDTISKDKLTKKAQAQVGKNQKGVILDINIKSSGKKLKTFNGGKIKLSVPYKLKVGETKDNIKVWYLKDDGSVEAVSCKYNPATGSMDFITNHLSKYMIVKFPFKDINEKFWGYSEVAYVYNNDIMRGISETSFAPDKNTTRAMIATVLYRLSKEEKVPSASSFKDSVKGQWYYDAVSWAEENGIVNGYQNGNFGVNDNLTREQLVKIMYSYAKHKKYDVSTTYDLSKFKDNNKVSEWATEPMKWALETGLLKGNPDGSINPQGKATRAEIAVIIKRFMNK